MTQLTFELPHCFEKWLRFNITNGTANFYHRDIVLTSARINATLNLIGYMRNHLHSAAKIITTTLTTQNGFVDLATGEIIVLSHF